MRGSISSAVVAGTVLLTAACDDSSPTEPRPSQTAARAVINDPAGAFSQHHAALRSLIEETTATAGTEISVGTVTFDVLADPPRTIPGYGIGGFALGPGNVEITVDPGYPNLGLILAERVPYTVAHELHHVVRWRGPGPPRTLLETLVFEGMADRFAVELLGARLQPWSQAFPESETGFYLDLAAPTSTARPSTTRAGSSAPTPGCLTGLGIPWASGSSPTTRCGRGDRRPSS